MIVDASVAFKWLVEERGSDIALSWLADDSLKAPGIMCSECGNALSKRIRGGELKAEGAVENLHRLRRLVTVIDEQPYLGRALEMAVNLDHSFYDCVYLAMSEALQEPLLTADIKFGKKLQATQWATLIHPWQALK